MKKIAATFAVACLLSATTFAQDSATQEATTDEFKVEEGFTSLFDGKSLDGWSQKNGTATYEVSDGTILGRTAVGSPNSFLCSEKDYSDFDLRFEVKVDKGLNSGVQIRSLSLEDFKKGRVHGPQVEIESDPGESGYIYSEGTGRGWVSPKQTQMNLFKNDGWNEYRVVAEGNRVRTWINGSHVEDLELPDVESQKGFFGLQVHGINKGQGPYKVAWRNIRVRELDGTETRVTQAFKGTPEIDGKVEDAWSKLPRILTSRRANEDEAELPEGEKPSVAWVKCMWDDEYLYCLAMVKDSGIHTDAEEPWQKDSVEFFVDGNMARSDSYDEDDAQYRTDADGNETCGGSNDLENYKSAVTKTDDGYIVEARIKIATKAGMKIGFDVQVNNDTGNGTRESTMKWNDPTNESYQDVSGLGTLEMIEK